MDVDTLVKHLKELTRDVKKLPVKKTDEHLAHPLVDASLDLIHAVFEMSWATSNLANRIRKENLQ